MRVVDKIMRSGLTISGMSGHRIGDIKMRIRTPETKIREKKMRIVLGDISTGTP